MHKETADALVDATNKLTMVDMPNLKGGYSSKAYAVKGNFSDFCEAIAVGILNVDNGDIDFGIDEFIDDCKNMICDKDSNGNWIFQ